MSARDGGKRVFPTHAGRHGERVLTGGITLREYYAGLALRGLLSNPNVMREMVSDRERYALAREAVRHADSLVEALEP